jgi:hypothetical protein
VTDPGPGRRGQISSPWPVTGLPPDIVELIAALGKLQDDAEATAKRISAP